MDQESKEEKKNGWALRKETLLSKTLRHTTPVSYTMHDTALQGYTKTPCASRHKTLNEKKRFSDDVILDIHLQSRCQQDHRRGITQHRCKGCRRRQRSPCGAAAGLHRSLPLSRPTYPSFRLPPPPTQWK